MCREIAALLCVRAAVLGHVGGHYRGACMPKQRLPGSLRRVCSQDDEEDCEPA